MQVDSTGTRLAPRQFNSAIEVAENAKRVMAFRQKSWMKPKVIAPVIHIPIVEKRLPWPVECLEMTLNCEVVGRLQGVSDPTEDEPAIYYITDIIRTVCVQTKTGRQELFSHRRTAELVRPRHIGMMLCHHLTKRSLPEIGRRFGGKDHTSVLHATKKLAPVLADVSQRIEEGAPIKDWVAASIESYDRILR